MMTSTIILAFSILVLFSLLVGSSGSGAPS